MLSSLEAQGWKRGELTWGWWKAWALYTTSGGDGVLLVASTEHRGSWLLSTDVKYFNSSVSCLISLRRAAFCFSRSSLSCKKDDSHQSSVSGKGRQAGRREGEARFVLHSREKGHQRICVYVCICACSKHECLCISTDKCVHVHSQSKWNHMKLLRVVHFDL